jgi:hypothetical protein
LANDLETLRHVQRVDSDMNAIAAEEKRFREGIERATEAIRAIEGEIAALRAGHDELDRSAREIGEEIRVNSERVAKDEGKMGAVTTDKGYKAITKEMGTARKAVKAAQERLDKLTPLVEAKASEISARDAALKEKEAELERLTKERDEKSGEWARVIEEKKKEKDALAASVNKSLFKQYETIRAKRAGVGLVQVQNETCQGCFIHVPPQIYIKLQKGNEVIACPHCHRILYYEQQA